MMRWRSQPARTAGAAAAAVAGVVLMSIPAAALADATAPRSAADCRAISDFELRGKCWDSLDQANQKDSQAEKKRSFGLGLRAPSIAAILPKQDERARERKLAEQEEVKDLTLSVASIDDSRAGHMLITSTDGVIWEQTDGDVVAARVSPGDTVKVTKGVLGGYMCQVTRWQAVRCQRDR